MSVKFTTELEVAIVGIKLSKAEGLPSAEIDFVVYRPGSSPVAQGKLPGYMLSDESIGAIVKAFPLVEKDLLRFIGVESTSEKPDQPDANEKQATLSDHIGGEPGSIE